MKPILTICPTRERPERFKEMFESFNLTSRNTFMIAVVDKDDPTLEEYRKFNETNHLFHLLETDYKTNTERFNKTFESFNDYKFYHITNDDVIYRTDQWDVHFMNILKARPGIAFGSDLMFKEGLCPTPFISGDLVRALGWLQMPRLYHLYGDNTWMIIGKLLRSIFYLDWVVIEHMHPVAKKAELDSVYEKDNSEEMYKHDETAFFEWCSKDALKDVKRISEYLEALTASP